MGDGAVSVEAGYRPKWPYSNKPPAIEWPVWDRVVDEHPIFVFPGQRGGEVEICGCRPEVVLEQSAHSHRVEIALAERRRERSQDA